FSRLGLCEEGSKYHEVQGLFMDNLEPDVDMFNEYHALIVRHAKERCRKREPVCEECILAKICNFNLKSKI
ncbi:MAG: endonuclease, partial [Pseudomonadota bacterium]